MSYRRDHERMENLDKCYNLVLQSGTRGTSAFEIATKRGIHKTTVHRCLNSLELMGRVYSEHGIWYAKKGDQTIRPLEKEIVIELPVPKDKWRDMAILEILAKDCEMHDFSNTAEIYRIPIEKFRETRVIKIKAKNVDDLDLEKLVNLIQQANQKASRFNLKGMLKSLKKSRANGSKRE